MNSKIKKGGFTGVIFAFIAYFLASFNGFNESTFTLLLYLYVALGVVASLNLADLNAHSKMDDILVVADEEEKKLKKLFSDEEYRIEGTIEKL